MNVRSTVGDEKKAQIRLGVNKIDPDVIIMTETWFNRNDGEFRIQGYKPVARCDRPTKPGKEPPKARGGGVLALAKTDIKITNTEEIPLHRDIQIVRFVINKITVFGIYRTGKAKDNHKKITDWLNTELNKLGDNPYIITGDLNLPGLAKVEFDPDLNPVGVDGQERTKDHMWTGLIKRHDLDQHVEAPTHIRGNILDYVFAPTQVSIPFIEVKTNIFDSNFNHFPIIFEIDSYYQRLKTEIYKRKESPASWKKFHLIMKLATKLALQIRSS